MNPNPTAVQLRALGKDVGYICAIRRVPAENPYTLGGWYHRAFQQGLDAGLLLGDLDRDKYLALEAESQAATQAAFPILQPTDGADK